MSSDLVATSSRLAFAPCSRVLTVVVDGVIWFGVVSFKLDHQGECMISYRDEENRTRCKKMCFMSSVKCGE